MSYYAFDYRNPPPAYDGMSATNTVPGWGVLPRAAGPDRIGVGLDLSRSRSMVSAAREPVVTTMPADETLPPPAAKAGVPWWVWVAVPGVLAGGAAVAVNMGWV